MANKETKAERREAARKARLEAQRRAQARSRRRKYVWSGAGLAAVAAIVAAMVLSGSAKRAAAEELNNLAEPAGCEVPAQQENEGFEPHATDVNEQIEYKTNPPNSGRHFQSWEDTGVHTAPISSIVQVHNMEHGHVGIQYSDALPAETVTALEEVVRADDQWAFLAPRPELDVPLAFTAWTWLSRCETPGSAEEVAAFAAKFIQVRKDQGRESVAGNPRG